MNLEELFITNKEDSIKGKIPNLESIEPILHKLNTDNQLGYWKFCFRKTHLQIHYRYREYQNISGLKCMEMKAQQPKVFLIY
jgi:hypothetical protein